MLRRRLLNATGPPIIARAEETTCGFGTDLMERAGLVAIASGLRRPIFFIDNAAEAMRAVVAPSEEIHAGEHAARSIAAAPFADRTACEHALAGAPRIPHKCMRTKRGRFVIEPRWEAANTYWDFRERRGRPGVVAASDLFADRPLNFLSHNAIGAFGPLIAAASIPRLLRAGATMSSSPRCVTAKVLDRVSVSALARVVELYAEIGTAARVVAVHVRRGDSAMHRECPECVAPNEPDVHSSDRIETRELREGLIRLNASLMPGRDGVFIASDTRGGLKMARQVLSGVRLTWQKHTASGAGKHSTQIRSVHAATRLLADFVAIAIADEVQMFGSSSFSGCAASLGGRVHGSGDEVFAAEQSPNS